VLNLHELTAVTIEEGVINERIYRRWFNNTFIKDYEATEAYIIEAHKTYESKSLLGVRTHRTTLARRQSLV
jgi:hypothetical protein